MNFNVTCKAGGYETAFMYFPRCVLISLIDHNYLYCFQAYLDCRTISSSVLMKWM